MRDEHKPEPRCASIPHHHVGARSRA
jgi:hypothetical protein